VQRVPEDLKRPIVEEPIRSSILKAELPEELQFLLGKTATKHGIMNELGEPRLLSALTVVAFFNKCEPLWCPRYEPFVQRYFHIEGREVNIPASNEWVQKGSTVFM